MGSMGLLIAMRPVSPRSRPHRYRNLLWRPDIHATRRTLITAEFPAFHSCYEVIPLGMTIREYGAIGRFSISQEDHLPPGCHLDTVTAIAHAGLTPGRRSRIRRTRTFHYLESSVRTSLTRRGAILRHRAHAHP